MRDFIHFLKAPSEFFKLTSKNLWSVILIYFLLLLIRVLLVSIPMFLGLESVTSSLEDVNEKVPIWFLMVVPAILEEGAFRSFLKRSPITLFISSCIFIWLIVSMIMPVDIYSTDKLLLRCGIALAGGALSTVLFNKPLIYGNYKAIFYISAILFGLMHVYNFIEDIDSILAFVSVLFTLLGHILCGIFFGYVRVGYGIHASMIAHFLNNLFPVLFLYYLA